MGKWSKRMDAGLLVSPGVLIADAAHAQADAVAVPPPLPLPRRCRRAWSNSARRLETDWDDGGIVRGAHAFTKAASAIAKPVATGSLTRASAPGEHGETTAILRLAVTF